MIRMSVTLEHDFFFVLHADLLSHTDGCDVGRIDHGNQSLDAQGCECKVADSAGSLAGIALGRK